MIDAVHATRSARARSLVRDIVAAVTADMERPATRGFVILVVATTQLAHLFLSH